MITGFLASLWPVRDQINKEGISYQKVDVTEHPEAREYVMSLGYLGAPVVYVSPTVHWSGFRPDRLAGLAAA
ncbi:glutaredoxin domain-containing protein [Mycobacterium kansasii]|uniref:glutaredoxin domain-containing protein n=1 Tax=Mycobacterium kansasii TaxID=1768 RepID=UPI000687897A|nr:glutaredoxin domain-containing protein [Mycobacterium kansasii]UGU28261.1 NrdH-redoxin [Mycobacterium kansasii]